jgi:branched-chain amino acid transport system permease protein
VPMSLEPTVLASLIVAGISRGMIYFLLAAGLTLIFGVLRVVNFAHGAFYMLGMFLCYTITQQFSFWVAFLTVPLILGACGALTEFCLFRRVYKAEHAIQLLLSLGVIYIISDVVRLGWGVTPKSLGMVPSLQGSIRLGGVIVTKYNLFILGLTLLVAALMFLILYRTKIGSIVRACTIDYEMTECVGIDVSSVFLLVFMVGVAIAGIAAVTASPIATASLGVDVQMIIIAFSLVIIGGVGSIGGALVAALIIGIVESVGVLVLPEFAEIFMYAVVVISLFVRPTGLFGRVVG